MSGEPQLNGANKAWVELLRAILSRGEHCSPRGRRVLELCFSRKVTTSIAALNPVVTVPGRAMGYRFMCAEAAWILSGDDRVSTIKPYSKMISRYSDDGETFYGAYGPRLVGQWDWCRQRLISDPSTRQAVITLWQPNPPAETRDVPCTLSYTFIIRENLLNLVVTMRSSDAWLGWVYDTFTQAMIICAMVGELRARGFQDLFPGVVILDMHNVHLYEENWSQALTVVGQSNLEAGEPALSVRPFWPGEFSMPDARQELAAHLWQVASFDTTADDLTYFYLRDLKEGLPVKPK